MQGTPENVSHFPHLPGLSYIPAPKPKLPGHAESYNPPAEYLPTEEDKAAYELMDPEDRPQFVPQAFSSLRHVPMYDKFIKEVRCVGVLVSKHTCEGCFVCMAGGEVQAPGQ